MGPLRCGQPEPDFAPLVKNPKIGVALALVFAASLWFYVYAVLVPYQRVDAAAQERPRGNLSDLYPRWLGSRELLLHRRNPYSAEITREIQVGYYGRELDPSRPNDPKDQQGFVYPVYVALLLAPTVQLPFKPVMIAFKCALVIFTVASVWLWLLALKWRPERSTVVITLLLTLGCFPFAQGFKLQQLSLVAAAFLALAVALLVRGHSFSSGVVVAVATIKPQLVLPLLVCLGLWTLNDWRSRQRFVWGFGLTMVILVGAGEWLLPGWIGEFRAAATDYRRYTGGQSLLDSLLSPAVGRVVSLIVLLCLIIVAWRLRQAHVSSMNFSLLVATALGATLVVIPMFAPYNQLLLLPAIFLIARKWGELWGKGLWSRVGCCLTAAIVGWPWLASIGLVVASLALPAATIQKGWAIPLYTSLAIPIVLLIQLASLLAESWSAGADETA